MAHVFDVSSKKVDIYFLDCDKCRIKAVMSRQIALVLDFCYLYSAYTYILCMSADINMSAYVCAIDIRIEIATRCVIRNLLPCRMSRSGLG